MWSQIFEVGYKCKHWNSRMKSRQIRGKKCKKSKNLEVDRHVCIYPPVQKLQLKENGLEIWNFFFCFFKD